MSETASRRLHLTGLAEQWRGHPIAFLAGMALVMALGMLVLQVACSNQAGIKAAPGDEPPIRVKGGSFDVELFAKKGTNSWKADGTWIAMSGKRNGNKISVLTNPRSTDAGCDWLNPVKSMVTVTFTDKTQKTTYDVIFDVREHTNSSTHNKELKTSVTSGGLRLTLDADTRKLSNQDDGFISKVIVDGTPCSFTEDDKAEIILFEQ